MLCLNDIKIEIESQGYKASKIEISENGTESYMILESTSKTKDVHCPDCGGDVYIHDSYESHLVDAPVWNGIKQTLYFKGHRYKCRNCNKSFAEKIPFRYPGTRITERAANWIKGFLKNKVSIKSIQEMTGIHWDTIRSIQKEYMQTMINKHKKELEDKGYKPRYLAIDEFAIHKGHRYATSVMDLEKGELIWVGKGRTLSDFAKFFEDVSQHTLSAVIAVAMDMNASYNKLVTEKLPNAQIVYDRYHMQAQYSRDVLGVVRLEEARKHKLSAKETISAITSETDSSKRKELRKYAKEQKTEYSKLKKSRWLLLINRENLKGDREECLHEILNEHQNLAICYAMKEEMSRLFGLTDSTEAKIGWRLWFIAAVESGIPALMKFAELKVKRLPGLIAHAEFPISTGRLEGFNNKIKVAKRIGYGYRDDDFFFLLIRYLSLQSSRNIPTNP